MKGPVLVHGCWQAVWGLLPCHPCFQEEKKGLLGGSDTQNSQWPVPLEKGAHTGIMTFVFLSGPES